MGEGHQGCGHQAGLIRIFSICRPLRECLAIDVAGSIRSRRFIEVLARLITWGSTSTARRFPDLTYGSRIGKRFTQLNSAIARILQMRDIRDQMLEGGSEIGGNKPEAFAAFVRTERARFRKLVAEAGIKPE